MTTESTASVLGRPVARGVRPTHRSYRHEALVWRGDDEFLAGTVPFITEGLRADQPVLVAVTPSRIGLLRDALADDATAVEFRDMTRMGSNPARIIPAWRSFIEEHAAAGRPLRGIGEPIWSGRRPAELAECQLHEALLNMAVDPDTPMWLLCPYDAEALTDAVIEEAHRSHPVIVETEHERGSSAYLGAHHVGALFEAELPGLDVNVPVSLRLFGRGDLAELRADVVAYASSLGVPDDKAEDLSLAVHEVAANSVEHGGDGRGTLGIWRQDDALICEVCDVGRIDDPMAGRRDVACEDERGRGLWIANQLCDLVQIRSGRRGTTVRIHCWLHRSAEEDEDF
ncbi:MAG: sensor histidine kinase [Lapillicoccus sp.]